MDVPSPYPRIGRPRIEDEPDPVVTRTVRLREEFSDWFANAARRRGMSYENAMRAAMLAWAREESQKS